MFTYLLISRESHFQFRVLLHVRSADYFTAHYKAYEIPDFVCFKAPVTGFDFCKWSHHYPELLLEERHSCPGSPIQGSTHLPSKPTGLEPDIKTWEVCD